MMERLSVKKQYNRSLSVDELMWAELKLDVRLAQRIKLSRRRLAEGEAHKTAVFVEDGVLTIEVSAYTVLQ